MGNPSFKNMTNVWPQESERAGGFGTLGDPAQQGEHALEGESTQEGATATQSRAAAAIDSSLVQAMPEIEAGPAPAL